jgi:hypothetical protein
VSLVLHARERVFFKLAPGSGSQDKIGARSASKRARLGVLRGGEKAPYNASQMIEFGQKLTPASAKFWRARLPQSAMEASIVECGDDSGGIANFDIAGESIKPAQAVPLASRM